MECGRGLSMTIIISIIFIFIIIIMNIMNIITTTIECGRKRRRLPNQSCGESTGGSPHCGRASQSGSAVPNHQHHLHHHHHCADSHHNCDQPNLLDWMGGRLNQYWPQSRHWSSPLPNESPNTLILLRKFRMYYVNSQCKISPH